MRIGEQHGQPVDPDAFASRRRHGVAQRADVVHVHFLGDLLSSLGHLLTEAPLLLDGIVQLGESVAQLEPAGKEFKSLGERRIIGAALRQRRNGGRKVIQDRRLDQLFLRDGLKQQAGQLALGELAGAANGLQPCLARPEIVALHDSARTAGRRELGDCGGRASLSGPVAADGFAHGKSLPATEVYFVFAVADGGRPADLFHQALEQLLGQIHQVAVVAIGLIKLQHGELRVVSGGDPLIAEVAVDLIDAIEASHHQPLQIELRRDA